MVSDLIQTLSVYRGAGRLRSRSRNLRRSLQGSVDLLFATDDKRHLRSGNAGVRGRPNSTCAHASEEAEGGACIGALECETLSPGVMHYVAEALTRDEALGVTVQIKNYLAGAAADGPLTIGVKAALAGSVLSNLPTTLPQGATEIPAILQGIESLTFQ